MYRWLYGERQARAVYGLQTERKLMSADGDLAKLIAQKKKEVA